MLTTISMTVADAMNRPWSPAQVAALAEMIGSAPIRGRGRSAMVRRANQAGVAYYRGGDAGPFRDALAALARLDAALAELIGKKFGLGLPAPLIRLVG